MCGPLRDLIPNLYVWFTILLISILYMTLVAPSIYDGYGPAILIINGIFITTTVLSLALVQFSDPGIIPRASIF